MKKNRYSTLLFFILSFNSFSQINYEWVESFGTDRIDIANSMIIDSSNNIIMVGMFRDSIDLDTSDVKGSGFLENEKHVSGFISKFNPDGSLQWAKQIKGFWGSVPNTLRDSIVLKVTAVSVDAEGNVYVTGSFNGLVDFNPSETETKFLTNPIPHYRDDVNLMYESDIFILKLGSDGSFKWVRQLGGQDLDVDINSLANTAGGILADKNHVYITGAIKGNGATFKTENNAYPIGDLGDEPLGSGGITGMFILKITDQGEFVWSKTIKRADPRGYLFMKPTIAVDFEGNVLVGGSAVNLGTYDSLDFDPGPGEVWQSPIFYGDGQVCVFSFVLKLNAKGEYIWVAINKGSSHNSVKAIETDSEGNVYYMGNFSYTDPDGNNNNGASNNFDANPDPIETEYLTRDNSLYHDGSQNVYIIKLDKNRNFIFAKNFGGNSRIYGSDFKINSKNEIYILGNTNVPKLPHYIDFDPDTTKQYLSEILINEVENSDRLFLLKLDDVGEFKWVRQFGGGCGNEGNVQFDLNKSECNVYVGGTMAAGFAHNTSIVARDFDPSTEEHEVVGHPYSAPYSSDIFLARYYDYTFEKPTITALGSLGFCPGESVQLTSVDTLKNYSWFPNNETTKTISVQESGKYALTTDYGCIVVSSDTLEVELFKVPEISQILPVSGTAIKIGESVNFQVSVNNGDSYSWSPNDSTLSCIDCLSPIATPPTSTEYCITVMSVDSCVATECLKINVEPICKDIFIPNAFSPNGDGNNDLLEIHTKFDCITDFSLQIFDRWGEMVFEATKPTEIWDGKFDGKELNSAVFVYQLKYKTIEMNEFIKKSGNVSIIR